MPFSYFFIKINKLRPNGNACVVKRHKRHQLAWPIRVNAHLDPPRLPKSNDEPPSVHGNFRLERRRFDFCGAAIRCAEPRKCVTPRHLQSLLLTFFSFGIGDAEFREAVTECVPGKTQGAGGLALVAIGAAEASRIVSSSHCSSVMPGGRTWPEIEGARAAGSSR